MLKRVSSSIACHLPTKCTQLMIARQSAPSSKMSSLTLILTRGESGRRFNSSFSWRVVDLKWHATPSQHRIQSGHLNGSWLYNLPDRAPQSLP